MSNLNDNNNRDEDNHQPITTTTTNQFLAALKEEVVLQSLLHKRIHDRKERVFPLEHRNGRRLLVVLPPDTQSAASFEEEARKTNWVNIMLNTKERVEGMLSTDPEAIEGSLQRNHLVPTAGKLYSKGTPPNKIARNSRAN